MYCVYEVPNIILKSNIICVNRVTRSSMRVIQHVGHVANSVLADDISPVMSSYPVTCRVQIDQVVCRLIKLIYVCILLVLKNNFASACTYASWYIIIVRREVITS